MSEENVDALRAVYAGWEKGDLGAGADLYDPDVLFIPPDNDPLAGRYLGHDGLAGVVRSWMEALSNLTITADEYIESGDSVVVATLFSGEGTESGAQVDMDIFMVWTFRGRAVIRLEFIWDRGEALEAVGLSE